MFFFFSSKIAISYKVKKCKDYIFTHLHGKLTLTRIADALSLNASYLSSLFHRSEGISITEFIRNEKINLAQNLLMYSDYSYSEIAAYLGFASQSHLGTQFRKTVGMTLREYREIYGKKMPFYEILLPLLSVNDSGLSVPYQHRKSLTQACVFSSIR